MRNRIEEIEMQLEIYRIEQESQLEMKKKEEKQKEIMNSHTFHEKQLEKDRVFASHLLTEIWRDTVTVQNGKPSTIAFHLILMLNRTTNTVESSVIFEVFKNNLTQA